MSKPAAIRLVKSLSKSEKRHFKLFTKKQSGKKDYHDLFDLIDQNNFSDKDSIDEKFKKLHPQSCIDNTARYLLRVLTDCLIQSKVKEDSWSQLLYGLLRITILKERNLPEEGYKELKKLQEVATTLQEQLIQYLLYRYERDYLAEVNFKDFSEKSLIRIQMESRNMLRDIRNTNEHYSLHELLKHRLVYSGKIQTQDDKKKLNDLLLSEMSIVNSRVKGNLESKKLHLLFQSHFFTHIGDYKSALETFYELNRLFEKNTQLLHNPPLGYYSSLDGILDSLRVMRYFTEMDFYIKKLELLDDSSYPEYYRFLIHKTIMIYRLVIYIGTKEFDNAIKYINESGPNLLKGYSMVDDEKQSELLFYIALSNYNIKNIKKAQKYINEIILVRRINSQSIIYRAARLLNMLIRYDDKDLDYLDYEIRSYKRSFKGNQKPLKTETLIFKVIKSNPDLNSFKSNEILWNSIFPIIQTIEKDEFEMQLLKYFDFLGWAKTKFRSPLSNSLK
jgi:hypothetical protein